MNREQYHANRRALFEASRRYRDYTSSSNQGYNSYTEAQLHRDVIEANRKVPRDWPCRKEVDWETLQFNRRFRITGLIDDRKRAKWSGLKLWPFNERLQRVIKSYRKAQSERLSCHVNLPK